MWYPSSLMREGDATCGKVGLMRGSQIYKPYEMRMNTQGTMGSYEGGRTLTTVYWPHGSLWRKTHPDKAGEFL